MRQSIIVDELLLTGNTLPSSSVYHQLRSNYKCTVNTFLAKMTCGYGIQVYNLQLHPMIRKPSHGINRPMRVEECSFQFFMTPRIVFCQHLWPRSSFWTSCINHRCSNCNITPCMYYHSINTMPICHIASASPRNFYLSRILGLITKLWFGTRKLVDWNKPWLKALLSQRPPLWD
jgi:hypothetical protein